MSTQHAAEVSASSGLLGSMDEVHGSTAISIAGMSAVNILLQSACAARLNKLELDWLPFAFGHVAVYAHCSSPWCPLMLKVLWYPHLCNAFCRYPAADIHI